MTRAYYLRQLNVMLWGLTLIALVAGVRTTFAADDPPPPNVRGCKDPDKNTAQARVYLSPDAVQYFANWGLRQGLINGSASLRAQPIADDPETGPPPPLDITKQRVDIDFGDVKTQCRPGGAQPSSGKGQRQQPGKTAFKRIDPGTLNSTPNDILCDFDIPITHMDYRFAVKGNVSYFKPDLPGVQLVLNPNRDPSKNGLIHFQAKITKEGGLRQLASDHRWFRKGNSRAQQLSGGPRSQSSASLSDRIRSNAGPHSLSTQWPRSGL